ncbi:MAG: efflux RND transporter permease subunit [Acutalibacteraceae bacterium]
MLLYFPRAFRCRYPRWRRSPSLILFDVSSVFEMPLESTPEMNMPTMTIMTSYPDASPDEVDEMVTQKIESALSGITEVESMTSTSSEGSSMIMLEFGYDLDTDDKYQDITSALAMVQLPEDCSDPPLCRWIPAA